MTNMRLQQVTNIEDNQELDHFQISLLDMETGNIYDECDENIIVPENLIEHEFGTEDSMQDTAIEFFHGDINYHIHDMNYMLNNVMIFPHNRNARKINEKIVQKLQLPGCLCFSLDTTANDCIYIFEKSIRYF